jgi:lipopolysaccharide export LptBFGC system permease protein LptF
MSEPTPASPRRPRIGPDHRDLYLIIFGIVAGVVAGPWVFGRLAPRQYDKLFVGTYDAQRIFKADWDALADFDEQTRRQLDSPALKAATPEARQSHEQARAIERLDIEIAMLQSDVRLRITEEHHRRAIHGYMLALLLTVLVLMVLETFLDPHATGRPRAIRNRLAAARYAAFGLWLALVIAAPAGLAAIPLPFLALAIVVALAAALVPMPQRRS